MKRFVFYDFSNPKPIPLMLLPGGVSFELGDDVEFNLGDDLHPLRLTLRRGYVTDLASIPSWVGVFGFDKLGRHTAPALVHDYLYTFQPVAFEVANAIFLDLMLRSGMKRRTAGLMAFAVEVAGHKNWIAAGKMKLAVPCPNHPGDCPS